MAARIPAGGTSDALIGLVDLPRTFATVVGQPIPTGALPDSVNVSAALLGGKGAKGRHQLVVQNDGQQPSP